MAASTRSKKTGRNLPFSSKMADICLQIKCREQRDYPPCYRVSYKSAFSLHSNIVQNEMYSMWNWRPIEIGIVISLVTLGHNQASFPFNSFLIIYYTEHKNWKYLYKLLYFYFLVIICISLFHVTTSIFSFFKSFGWLRTFICF